MLALSVGATPGTAASEASRQRASLEFTSSNPDTPAGLVLGVDYMQPGDPDAKPPAVRRVTTTLAPGARYDTSVPARCKATDAELIALGEAACPAASKVGVGSLRFDTGVGGPQRFVDVTVDFFNNTDELIFLNTEDASGARTVLRAPIRGRSIVSDVPPLPGTPPDGGALDTSNFEDFVIAQSDDSGPSGYIVTPARCPASGHWTNRVTFTYADGETQIVESRSPCVTRRGDAESVTPRGCLPRRLRVTSLRIGPARLGASVRGLARRYRAVRRGRGATRFCVEGGGRFLVAARRGRIELVSSTAQGHATHRTAPGRALTSARLNGVRKVRRALLVGTIRGRGPGRVAYGTRRGRVAYLAIARREDALRRLELAQRLRALGLRR